MLSVSVIICSHNPREDYLRRVLEALKAQTLPSKNWELLLIDNASKEPLAGRFDLSWHPNARHVREDKSPRLRGTAESKGDLLVFVDDDNVPRSDYLAASLKISAAWPQLGAWSGSYLPEFETEPPAELRPWLHGLSIEKLTDSYWGRLSESSPALPTGAGMSVRRSVALHYHDEFLRDPLRQMLAQNGNQLAGGQDSDLALSSLALGLGTGRFPELELTHLIPAQRLTLEYLEGIHEGFGYRGAILRAIHLKENSPPGTLNSFFLRLALLNKSPVERKIKMAEARGRRSAQLELQRLL
jgi:glycosyltransferase involved in cell wall biosynthesis